MAKVQTQANQPAWKQALHRILTGIKWTLIIALIGVGGFDLFRFLFQSDFFAIQNIEVEGCRQTTEQEFIAMAEIEKGSNIFHLSTNNLAQRLELHPWIETARVVRVLPATIRIVLYERNPIAAINSRFDGQIYGIDSKGYLLPEIAAPGGATTAVCFDLPIITGLPAEQIFPGNQMKDAKTLKAIKTLMTLQSLQPELHAKTSEIHISEEGELTLFPLERSGAIYLGSEHLEKRTWRLAKVWQYLESHDITTRYIDCRFDAQGVVTRPENLSREKWNSLPQTDRNLFLADTTPILTGEQNP